MTQPKIMDWNKGLKHFSIDGFEHTISFHTWLKSLIVIWFWKETFQCSFIRFMSRLQILNVFTLKEKIQENEMHFVIWCFISAKEKLLHKLQKKICAIYTDGAIYKSNVQKLFNRFRRGNFDREDWERSHQPAVIDDDQIRRQIKKIRQDIAEIIHISH